MTSRVSSENKEDKAKRKNSVKKKKRPNGKKNGTKEHKTASPGVEPGLSARSRKLLDHSTTVTHMI